MPIRLRLALASALAMTVLLTIAGSFLYWRLASDLSRSLNQELRQRAADLSVVVGSPGRPARRVAGWSSAVRTSPSSSRPTVASWSPRRPFTTLRCSHPLSS